jgi:uncharacterized protein YdiU (UPF0061 family)
MDHYRPAHVSNHTDQQGRYAFNQQPDIVLWNLACLAQALLPLIPRESLKSELEGFAGQFRVHYQAGMRARLGLLCEESGDTRLIDDLGDLMARQAVDMTRFFRMLGEVEPSTASPSRVLDLFPDRTAIARWIERYAARTAREAATPPLSAAQMRAVNPKFILRNYMAEEAIRAADAGDYRLVNELSALLRHPFSEHPDHQRYAEAVPDWAGWISLSCSS